MPPIDSSSDFSLSLSLSVLLRRTCIDTIEKHVPDFIDSHTHRAPPCSKTHRRFSQSHRRNERPVSFLNYRSLKSTFSIDIYRHTQIDSLYLYKSVHFCTIRRDKTIQYSFMSIKKKKKIIRPRHFEIS